jgi:hypothetical protein
LQTKIAEKSASFEQEIQARDRETEIEQRPPRQLIRAAPCSRHRKNGLNTASGKNIRSRQQIGDHEWQLETGGKNTGEQIHAPARRAGISTRKMERPVDFIGTLGPKRLRGNEAEKLEDGTGLQTWAT